MTAPLVRRLHEQLSSGAWPEEGMSPTNHVIGALIILSAVVAIMETEARLVDEAAWLFEIGAVIFPMLFAIEYGARVYAAGAEVRYAGMRGRLRYMATPCAMLDLVAIAPALFATGANTALLLRLFRLVRLVRLARFGRLSMAIHALIEALERRCFELGLSLALAVMILIASGTLMYLVEGTHQPEAFGSIPRALWWSVATLTTVGYGDVYPVTAVGRAVAGATAIVAIGLVAMPAGILAAAFTDAFQRRRSDPRP
ncbi:MAG: ion transporter [Geminicoccales bacterium]